MMGLSQQESKYADIIGALSLEAMKGVINAFDPRVMAVRPHPDQLNASENVRRMLKGSGVMEKYRGSRVQDALSLRCIPQLHGAARKTLEDAKKTIEIEMNSCCDNPNNPLHSLQGQGPYDIGRLGGVEHIEQGQGGQLSFRKISFYPTRSPLGNR